MGRRSFPPQKAHSESAGPGTGFYLHALGQDLCCPEPPVLSRAFHPATIPELLTSMSAQELLQPYQHFALTVTFIYHSFEKQNFSFVLLLVSLYLKLFSTETCLKIV